MSQDHSQSIHDLRGDDYVIATRAAALIASVQNGHVRCAGCREQRAAWIGMQRCGAPGGPVCQDCLDLHFEWIRSWDTVKNAVPTCRHCGDDVDATHIYAVDLFDPTAAEALP